MKTLVVVEAHFFLAVLQDYIEKLEDVLLVVDEARPARALLGRPDVTIFESSSFAEKELYERIALEPEDRILLYFRDRDRLKTCLDTLRTVYPDIPITVAVGTGEGLEELESYEHVFVITLANLISEELEGVWHRHANNKRIRQLLEISQSGDNILILVQHDPDPDALASALALRVLLGRNKQTAPIGSFGTVTRSENLNMMRLLEIPIIEVDRDGLQRFAKLALVDVQPPYFKDLSIVPDIVIDHHPCFDKYEAGFVDVRVPYGATATIMGEYLIDAGVKITQRLATALVYGIKTDTMLLDRGITTADIHVFMHFYPMANLNILRQIEHVSLEFGEMTTVVHALKTARMIDNMLFAFLGKVEREDMVPRLADFCLQLGGTQWAFVSAIFQGNLVCCVRNVGYVKHAGELVFKAFGDIGSAGGHRSMAKAVMPVNKFKKRFKVARRKQIGPAIIEALMSVLA
jgi:nanoRNase/pAp phosphatase (c-di-AMP/oligoRNAs hydrolase)